jgi:hypothetical protein
MIVLLFREIVESKQKKALWTLMPPATTSASSASHQYPPFSLLSACPFDARENNTRLEPGQMDRLE